MRIKSIAKRMTFSLMNSRKKCIKPVSLFKYLVIFPSFSSNKQKRQSYTKIHLSNALLFSIWRFDEIFVCSYWRSSGNAVFVNRKKTYHGRCLPCRTMLRSIVNLVNRKNTSKVAPPDFWALVGCKFHWIMPPAPLLLNELVTLYQMRRVLCCYCTLHKSGEFHDRKIFVGQCCQLWISILLKSQILPWN